MTIGAASTQDDLRRHNRARILRHLHERGAARRSDLVALTGLNRSTVGVLVSELAAAGLVVESSGRAGRVGRPSLIVAPAAESAVVVALDVRVNRTVVALVGLGGRELWRRELAHRQKRCSPASVVKNIVALTQEAMSHAAEGSVWVGIGVGVPGTVDRASGLIRSAPNLDWQEVPLADLMRPALVAEFGQVPPLSIANDADLGAAAEHVRGVGVEDQNVVFLSGDVGIGGGIIIGDRPMLGAGGFGGEVGHMVVHPEGRRCRCGADGCWETEIGSEVIVRSAGSRHGFDSVEDVVTAAIAGDERARAAVSAAGEWLGVGLANLVNIFNPEVIVLGGHLRLLQPLVTAQIDRHVSRALPAGRGQVRVEPPALQDDSILMGAAELAFQRLLTDPLRAITQPYDTSYA